MAMAVSTPGYILTASIEGARSTTGDAIPRRISPTAGRALEKLGHAIEYLTDEYVLRSESLNPGDPELEAVQILMALNREIYFACPVVPTWSRRLRGLFRRRNG
jgi:hypothetical protein